MIMPRALGDRLFPHLVRPPWLDWWLPFLLLIARAAVLPLASSALEIAPSPSALRPAYAPSFTAAGVDSANYSSAPTPTNSPPSNSTNSPYGFDQGLNKPYQRMAVLIATLFVVILLFGFCTHYVSLNTCCRRRPRNREARAEQQRLEQNGSGGLDPWLVRSLPTARYTAGLKVLPASEVGKDRDDESGAGATTAAKQECTVCLSEFEEGEEMKSLPECGHAFHSVCIDMWLFSHTTCPICRLSLVKGDGSGKKHSGGRGDQPRGGLRRPSHESRGPDPLLAPSTSVVLQIPPPPDPAWHAEVEDDEARDSSSARSSSARNSSVALCHPQLPSS